MYETTHTPASWIALLNKLDPVLVPSSWLVEAWRSQGLQVPISVYGHGVDPQVYYPLDRPEREVFNFLHYGQLSYRKGTKLVVKAFRRAFPHPTNVQLILKNTIPVFPVPFHLPGVKYLSATLSKEGKRDLLYQADCFVFPTRGEGFGLPPFEAMATGCPAIVTNWSGPADYADRDDTLLLDYRMTRAKEFDHIYREFYAPGEHADDWAEPSLDDLVDKMRWALANRSTLKSMGQRAAARIARSWTWQHKVGELIAVLDRSSR